MRNVWIIVSIVITIVVAAAVGLSVGFLFKKRKIKCDSVPVTSEIIWSFHLENESDLELKGTLQEIFNVAILKKENYSVGGNNICVKSYNYDFPGTQLTGWTHTYQHPLRIRKFIVGSNEVVFSKLIPISGFTVFNTQVVGDFVTIWHDGDFHHYSKTGVLLSRGAFPFANGDISIHPNFLKIPTIISEDEVLTSVNVLQSESNVDILIEEVTKAPEPTLVPEPVPVTAPERVIETEIIPVLVPVSATEQETEPESDSEPVIETEIIPVLVPVSATEQETEPESDSEPVIETEIIPVLVPVSEPVKEPDGISFNTIEGFPTGLHITHVVEKPQPLLIGVYPELSTTGWSCEDLDVEQESVSISEQDSEGVSFDTVEGFPSGINITEIVEKPKPILNGLYPDYLRTGSARDELDLSKKRKTVYTDFDPSIGFPSGWHDNSDIVYVPEPILNGLYPDVLTTGWAVDDLVHEERPVFVNQLYPDHVTTGSPSYDLEVEPDPEPILNGLYPDTIRTGSTVDELVREERPVQVNQQYPDFASSGCPSYDLEVEPDPKPILNGLYPDTIRTGWARDDLDIQPQPHPILNGLYPDHLRTGSARDELDLSKKRKTVYTDFDPSIGFPSGWHDNSDIVYVPEPILNGLYPDVLTTGWAVDDLVHEERPVFVNQLYPDHVTTGSPSYDLEVEPDPEPILNGLYPDTIRTGSTVDELVREERPVQVNQQYPDFASSGCPSYDLEVEPDPKPILNGLYPDTIRTGWARDDLDIQPQPHPILNGLYPDHLRTGSARDELDLSKKRKTVYTDFDPSIGFPSGWHDNSDIVYVPEPILNGLYPDVLTTGWAVDDLVHEERPVFVNQLYPDHVTTGSPSYDLEVEPDPEPILNGLYPDTIRTGSTVDELVREERPVQVNQQYPDFASSGCPSYDLEVEPDPKPILNGLYPDTIRTGWARDDLDIQPQPHPILNGLYPDHLRTGSARDELDLSKKRKTVYTDFDPSIGFPSGWHDNSDIVYVPEPILNGLYPDVLTTGWAVDDLVHEERPVFVNQLYPDHVTTGSPSYDLEVEPDPEPILNGLYPDTIRTGSTVDELVREERPVQVNQQYPDFASSGCPSYDLEVEPDPKPILNGLYPDYLRTGSARDELDLSKKRKTVYTDFDPSIGFPSGWHDKSDIVELDTEPILNGLYPDVSTTGWSRDNIDIQPEPESELQPEPESEPEPQPEQESKPESEPEPQPEPETKPESELLLNDLYPDVLTTGWTLDDLNFESDSVSNDYKEPDESDDQHDPDVHESFETEEFVELDEQVPDESKDQEEQDLGESQVQDELEIVKDKTQLGEESEIVEGVEQECEESKIESVLQEGVEENQESEVESLIQEGVDEDSIEGDVSVIQDGDDESEDVDDSEEEAYSDEEEEDEGEEEEEDVAEVVDGEEVFEAQPIQVLVTESVPESTTVSTPEPLHEPVSESSSEPEPQPEPETKPESELLLNDLYPDVLTTGWTLDDLNFESDSVSNDYKEPDESDDQHDPDVHDSFETEEFVELDEQVPDESKDQEEQDLGESQVQDELEIVKDKTQLGEESEIVEGVEQECEESKIESVLQEGVEENQESEVESLIQEGVDEDSIEGDVSVIQDGDDESEDVDDSEEEAYSDEEEEDEGEEEEEDVAEVVDGEEVFEAQPIQVLVTESVPESTTVSTPEPLHEPVSESSSEPEPQPEPETKPESELLLNDLYPDVLTTGWTLDDLDISKKRKTVDTEFDPFIGFPSGWHDNSDIIVNTITFVNILPEMNLGNKDLVFDFSVITLATEDTPYKILQNDDEMIIKKVRIDDVFKKYSCTLNNERSFRPQIRYLLSNFQLDVEDISEFELFVGEYDEPLLMRMKNPSGWTTYIRKSYYKWEVGNVSHLDINVLDKHYLKLREDITMIDCSKTSGTYVFGKYKIVVTEMDVPNRDRIDGYKTYIHTIYHKTDSGFEFATAKVHRFKYDNVSLKGFVRYHSIRKVFVYFWEHDLTKPVYIRTVAEHGFGNYFGYPNYILQTDISSFSYFLSVTNFEVNNALVINLARHEDYDFEGGISLHLTRHQVSVNVFENLPFPRFRRNVHTLTVGNVNKPFSILRFLNEPGVTVDPTKVSSLEAYYHNNHLKKPLLVILNGSSRQSFFKLENDSFVKIDYLLFNLEVTLKYLEYHNYNYVTLNVSKTTAYHYTGAPNPSSMPDRDLIVSVDKDELTEFSKYSHSIKVDNKASKFKLIGLEGVDIRFDDPEITSMASYFHNDHAKTPLAIVLKSITDVLYVKKGDFYIKRPYRNVDQSLDILRSLVQLNLGIVYLKLDQKSNYYTTQDDGLNVEVSRGDKSHEGYTHYVHKFPKSKEFRFLNGTNFFHPKVDQGQFEKADVFVNGSNFPTVVSLYGAKGTGCHFIFQNDGYKKAKLESVERKLSSGQKETQPQAQQESQPGSQTPLIKPPPKPSIKPKQVKPQTSSQPSTPGQPQAPKTGQSQTPKTGQSHTPKTGQAPRPKQDQSPKPCQAQSSSQPLPKPTPKTEQAQKPTDSPTTLLKPSVTPTHSPTTKQTVSPPPVPKPPPSMAQSASQPVSQTTLIKPSVPSSQTSQDQSQTKLIKPSVPSSQTSQDQSQTKLIKPSVPSSQTSQDQSQTKLIKPSVPSSQTSQDQSQTKLIKPSVSTPPIQDQATPQLQQGSQLQSQSQSQEAPPPIPKLPSSRDE